MTTATAPGIARVARRNQVLQGAIMPVMVQVIDAQRVGILRVGSFPANQRSAPAARMSAGTDGVIEHDPVNVGAAVREGQRVAGELTYPVSLWVKRLRHFIGRPGSHHAPVMQAAESLRFVGFGAAFDGAAERVPGVMDVSVVFQPPVVHLAEALALVRFGATLNRAQRFLLWLLERAERVTVSQETKAVSLAVAVRVMTCMAAINRTLAHTAILRRLRARSPSFYGATYCCSCRLHLPVGRQGEFVWVDADDTDIDLRVGE